GGQIHLKGEFIAFSAASLMKAYGARHALAYLFGCSGVASKIYRSHIATSRLVRAVLRFCASERLVTMVLVGILFSPLLCMVWNTSITVICYKQQNIGFL
ncbi:MAG: hypothetical protein WCD42_07265, partial [Rhizomicrobium sp.]